jgi:hypothetical protein
MMSTPRTEAHVPGALRGRVVSRGPKALVRTYWRHYAQALPEYRSPECRKAGVLDVHRAGSIWP